MTFISFSATLNHFSALAGTFPCLISAHRPLNHIIKLTQQLKYNGHIITLMRYYLSSVVHEMPDKQIVY